MREGKSASFLVRDNKSRQIVSQVCWAGLSFRGKYRADVWACSFRRVWNITLCTGPLVANGPRGRPKAKKASNIENSLYCGAKCLCLSLVKPDYLLVSWDQRIVMPSPQRRNVCPKMAELNTSLAREEDGKGVVCSVGQSEIRKLFL